MATAPEYKVEDRSVLLPFYKRFLIEPVLPRVPATLSPNAITLAGHSLCLAALIVLLPVPSAWSFATSAVLLQAYLWCDNADGAHARRIGRASTAGEYLDHGLDLLNCAYIGVISAFSIGLEDRTTGIVLASVIPAAAALTAWEQAVTGVYRLAALNQIESFVCLTKFLVLDVVLGVGYLHRVVLGLSVQLWIWLFVVGTIGFQSISCVIRVRAAGRNVLPGFSFIVFLASIWAAHSTAGLSTRAACTLCAVGAVAFGTHVLRTRVAGERLGWPTALLPSIAGAALLIAPRVVDASLASGLSLLTIAFCLGLAVFDAVEIARRASTESVARRTVPEVNE